MLTTASIKSIAIWWLLLWRRVRPGDCRSERLGQLSARLAGVPQRFQLLPSDLLLVFQDFMESFRGGALHIDSRDSSNFMPRASTLLAWADVRVGFPSALMRVVAPSAPSTAFCATVGIVWRGLIGI